MCSVLFTCITKHNVKRRQRSKSPWGFYWENKTYKLKRSIVKHGKKKHKYVVPFFIFQRYQEILTSKLSSVGVFGVVFFVPNYSEIAKFLFLFLRGFFADCFFLSLLTVLLTVVIVFICRGPL